MQARARDVEGALKNARRALSLAPPGEGPLMWALLALLLTARKEGQVAFSVIEAGLLQVGLREQLLLLRIKAKLHQLQGSPSLKGPCQFPSTRSCTLEGYCLRGWPWYEA